MLLADFVSLETVSHNTQSFHCKIWDVFVLFIVFNRSFIIDSMVANVFQSSFVVLLSSLLPEYRSFVEFCKVLAIPFLVASKSPVSFLMCMTRTFLSCVDIRDRIRSFKLFKNAVHLLMSFGSCASHSGHAPCSKNSVNSESYSCKAEISSQPM